MIRITSQTLFLISLALAGCVNVNWEGRDGHTNGIGPNNIESIKRRLSEVRGLAFAAEVPVLFETKEGYSENLKADLNESLGNLKREERSLAYAKLGLLSRGVDLRSGLLNYYSAQGLGLYNSTTKKIALLVSQDFATPLNDPLSEEASRVLVHELVHALQDQHFSLAEKLRPSHNGDQILALRAVAEGDAVLSEYAFRFGGLQDWVAEYARQIVDAETLEPKLSDVPALIVDKVRFQYLAGLNFVTRFAHRQGWLPLNRVYKNPPLSTEQVLHPEKYFATPDPPTRVALKGLGAIFLEEWTEIDNDTLGEALVHCLLKQYLGVAHAALVADGWDGDRFIAFRNGDDVAFIWATVWDSPKEAGEFYENYHKILSMKYSPQSLAAEIYIEMRGASVIIVEGLERGRVERNIGTIWSRMTLEEERFQLHP